MVTESDRSSVLLWAAAAESEVVRLSDSCTVVFVDEVTSVFRESDAETESDSGTGCNNECVLLSASPVATASVRYLKVPEEPEALSTVPSESLGWRLVPIVIMSDTESESDGDPVPLEPEDIESDSMSESEMRGADVVEIESFITIESDAKTGPFKAAVTMSEAWNESDTAMVLAVAIASATPSESDSERLTPADMASLITIE